MRRKPQKKTLLSAYLSLMSGGEKTVFHNQHSAVGVVPFNCLSVKYKYKRGFNEFDYKNNFSYILLKQMINISKLLIIWCLDKVYK